MAHTPGDWFYDRRAESIGAPAGWLGSTKGREGNGLGDQHDDGQLMAGAPAMLVALEAQERLDKMWDATENKAFSIAKKIKLWEEASREAIRLREIALDKVRGEENRDE